MSARRLGDPPVTNTEARTVACPKCEAPVGCPCVRVRTVPPGSGHRSAAVRELLGQLGTPVARCHNERRHAAHAARKRARGMPQSIKVALTAKELETILDGKPLRGDLAHKLDVAYWRLTGKQDRFVS